MGRPYILGNIQISPINMHGKVCLVTGGTSGIGKETARELARLGASVVIVGRNIDRAITAVSEIQKDTGNNLIEFIIADLSSQASIHNLAGKFLASYTKLDVLINNAGKIFLSRQTSVDGIEMTFALNHLSYFLLTRLLIESLLLASPSRIVNVSSTAHHNTIIDFNDIECRRRYLLGIKAYRSSKLCNVLFTYELARRLKGTGVTANALHPGVVSTNLLSDNGFWGPILTYLLKLRGISSNQGANTSVYLATSPTVTEETGKYFYNCEPIASSDLSYDCLTSDKLWTLSSNLTGTTERGIRL